MENNIIKYKINEGDIIKIGRITIRITSIKNDRDIDDDLNLMKNGYNISNNSINIVNSNNNSKIINENKDIASVKKKNINQNHKNIESQRKGANQTIAPVTKESQSIATNQTMAPVTKESQRIGTYQTISPATKASCKTVIKEEYVNSDKNYEVNIINENVNENENSEIKSTNSQKNNDEENYNINKRKYSKNKICRICYMEEDDSESNPLLNPCICAGSMKYIHFNCLRQWIISKCYSKIENSNINCSIFKIKPVECELCKTKFPDIITKNGNQYNISEFKPEYEKYLIFESLTLDKNKNKYNYIVSLNENDNKIYVGRDKESNILFSDISVSRIHCTFNIENNNIYINDNDSTFGTLILLQASSINLIENLPLYMQIGRSFLKILPKKKSNFFCCNASEKPNNKYYFNQNEKQVSYQKKITLLNLDDIKNNEKHNNKDINTNGSETGINIKKIIIKKTNESNNSQVQKKDNIQNYLSNYYENTEKINAIKDYSVNSKSLRKIKLNDDLIEQKKQKDSIDINRNENIINKNNEIKKDDLIDNNINDDNKSNQSKSIYIDENN